MSDARIGTRERELAMGALDEHRAAGRLDVAEYTERSANAAAARTRGDLDALFADLPEPHPAYPTDGREPDPAGAAAGASEPAPSATARRPGDDGRDERDLPELVAPLGATLGRNAGKLSALAPVIAFGLFALTGFRFPVVFLLVPVAIAVLGYLGHRHEG